MPHGRYVRLSYSPQLYSIEQLTEWFSHLLGNLGLYALDPVRESTLCATAGADAGVCTAEVLAFVLS